MATLKGAPADKQAFGRLLKSYRLSAGLRQEKLAERAGLSAPAISNLERGVNRPRLETVTLLVEALGLTPEQSRALRAATGLPEDVPSPLPATRHNLPVPPTPLVGRERDIRAVLEQLQAPMVRLLTLVGMGGVGKTRLALAVAHGLLDECPAGVWLVPLGALTDPAHVPGAVAAALGLREEPQRPLLATLTGYLRDTPLLLVLDNCEHLLEVCAGLAGGLLSACPRLRLLATSRERLMVSGEYVYRVPPLSVPDPHRPLPVEMLEQYDAVRLFVARARAQRQSFALSARNAQAVAVLCTRLDGLPLAIELAAARVGSLGVEAIAARLDERFRLLAGGPRDAAERQQALRATLDWSWELLSAPEQALLRRLTVFAGGWTLEAAEDICAGSDVGLDGWAVLEVLAGLVRKSLVEADDVGTAVRYRLLETVRQYAGERLGVADEAGASGDRHLDWFLALAEEAEPRLSGPELPLWLERLETELDNLRAALGWAQQQGDGVRFLRLAGALWRFWLLRGHFSEGRRWLEAALPLDGGRGAPTVRARALAAAGALACEQGDNGRAMVLLEEALALRRALGEAGGIADALSNLGNVVTTQGDYERAVLLYEESVALARPLGEEWRTANVLNNLGNVATLQGDYDRAAVVLDEALALWRTLEDAGGAANSLHNRGIVAYVQGDHERAGRLLGEALRLSFDIGDKDLTMEGLEGLAWVAVARGRPEHAARLGGAAETQRAELGVPLEQDKQAGHARALQAIQTALGAEALAQVWAAGCALALEDAVALALSDEPALSA